MCREVKKKKHKHVKNFKLARARKKKCKDFEADILRKAKINSRYMKSAQKKTFLPAHKNSFSSFFNLTA